MSDQLRNDAEVTLTHLRAVAALVSELQFKVSQAHASPRVSAATAGEGPRGSVTPSPADLPDEAA